MSELTQERVSELLSYDSEKGVLTWLCSRGSVTKGALAGQLHSDKRNQYIRTRVDGKKYFAHRLIWLLINGEWPSGQIDHIDGNGLNNRVENLRDVSQSENLKNSRAHLNNSSGETGVFWHKRWEKWRAQIRANGKANHLGYFQSVDEAADAYKSAKDYYGYSDRHGCE
jgi:hypothetical protein